MRYFAINGLTFEREVDRDRCISIFRPPEFNEESVDIDVSKDEIKGAFYDMLRKDVVLHERGRFVTCDEINGRMLENDEFLITPMTFEMRNGRYIPRISCMRRWGKKGCYEYFYEWIFEEERWCYTGFKPKKREED